MWLLLLIGGHPKSRNVMRHLLIQLFWHWPTTTVGSWILHVMVIPSGSVLPYSLYLLTPLLLLPFKLTKPLGPILPTWSSTLLVSRLLKRKES